MGSRHAVRPEAWQDSGQPEPRSEPLRPDRHGCGGAGWVIRLSLHTAVFRLFLTPSLRGSLLQQEHCCRSSPSWRSWISPGTICSVLLWKLWLSTCSTSANWRFWNWAAAGSWPKISELWVREALRAASDQALWKCSETLHRKHAGLCKVSVKSHEPYIDDPKENRCRTKVMAPYKTQKSCAAVPELPLGGALSPSSHHFFLFLWVWLNVHKLVHQDVQ